jgi:FKBP-type peptidyl-prolyl cis-trans isomerase FklB
MKEGAKWKLFIPPQLGYGERGAAGIIPGGAVLVFTVTLLEVLDVHEKDEL